MPEGLIWLKTITVNLYFYMVKFWSNLNGRLVGIQAGQAEENSRCIFMP